MKFMKNRSEWIDNLSPEEQRALLADWLRKKTRSPHYFPLSFAQERLWFLAQVMPDSPVYNIPVAYRLTGPLNVAVLEQSLNEMVRHHEVLRTTFVRMGGKPVQMVAPTQDLSLEVISLQNHLKSAREAEALRLANQEARRPFDLERGPLMRVTLLQLAEEEHIFLLVMHHMISEAWSLALLFQEVAALYEAFSAGQPRTLPELPIQYADFAHWQREWMSGEVLEAQLSHWRGQLSGELPVLELPIDHPRPAVQTFRGAFSYLMLPGDLTASLKALSRREGLTLFMTLLSAFKTLLHRYTGQADIIVGSPIAGRTRPETEKLIGFFVNTLALRTDLSGDPSFRELLGRVREVCLGAYAHQELPFEKLVEELQPNRHLSHTPLFQVMFALQNAPTPVLELGGVDSQPLSPFCVHNGATKVDLSLIMSETSQGLMAAFEYSTDLFEEATITRMLRHFQRLLTGVVENPDSCLSKLPLLTEAERRQLLVEWNDTRRDYPRDQCIHSLYEVQVERRPEAVAVIFEDQPLTYRELNHRANQLAHHLQALGVGPEVRVGLCMERSIEMVVGLLGILKAGGAYVPLDATSPGERLAFMLSETRAPVLLTQQRLMDRLPPIPQAQVVCLDTDWEVIAQASVENPVNAASADNLAYVIYTSGSTGRPRGVSIPHRGVVRLVQSTNYADLTKDEVFLQFAPVSFDASTFEIWGSLLNGARLVIFPPHLPSLEELGRVIKQHEVTTLWLTAGLFHQMVEQHLEAIRDVRQLLAGGDVLSVPHVQAALHRLNGGRLINGYGPTENTTFTCCYPMTDSSQVGHSVSIGRPIANTQVYILDRHLEPVPIGVPGELYIGGDGLARDYLNEPKLTAERFIPNPFAGLRIPICKSANLQICKSNSEIGLEPGARLYRTGDLARYLPNGSIEFLGRNDYQVKIRGFRIELGEIEVTLSQHPAVQQVVVLAREGVPGDKRLMAYLVPVPEQRPAVEELRRFLKEKLPDYMMPAAFVFLETLPLTPNGKVERQALPALDEPSPELEAVDVAPRTEVERTIAAIWREALPLEQVGMQDNFFDLGGHSLLLVQVHSKLREVFQKEISMVDMFKYPTINALATYLSQETPEQASIPPGEDSVEKRKAGKNRLKQLAKRRQRAPK